MRWLACSGHPRCREPATYVRGPGRCERPDGRRRSSSEPGCAVSSRGVGSSLADRRWGGGKNFCCVTTRGRNVRVLNGFGCDFGSQAAPFLVLSVAVLDHDVLAASGLAASRLPAADFPLALWLLAVALVPASRLVLASATFAQADPWARSRHGSSLFEDAQFGEECVDLRSVPTDGLGDIRRAVARKKPIAALHSAAMISGPLPLRMRLASSRASHRARNATDSRSTSGLGPLSNVAALAHSRGAGDEVAGLLRHLSVVACPPKPGPVLMGILQLAESQEETHAKTTQTGPDRGHPPRFPGRPRCRLEHRPGLPQGRHRTHHLLPLEGPPGGPPIE